MGKALPLQAQHKQSMRPTVRMATLGMAVAWLTLVTGLGWWMSQRVEGAELDRLAASAEYEAKTTARIMDRLFTEMSSVANMVARQGSVIQLATRYRDDPPSLARLTRQQRAAQFTQDPLVRKVGNFMHELLYGCLPAMSSNPQCFVKKSAAALYPACDVDAGLPLVRWPRCNPLTSASSPRTDF